MSDDMTPLTDTRDMICVHDVFRRALADAPRTGRLCEGR